MNTFPRLATGPALLELRHVQVAFPIYHGGARSLKKNLLFRGSAGRIARDGHQRVTVEALKDVSHVAVFGRPRRVNRRERRRENNFTSRHGWYL